MELLVNDECVLLTSPTRSGSPLARCLGGLCSRGSVFPIPISGFGSLARSLLLLCMSFLLRFGLWDGLDWACIYLSIHVFILIQVEVDSL